MDSGQVKKIVESTLRREFVSSFVLKMQKLFEWKSFLREYEIFKELVVGPVSKLVWELRGGRSLRDIDVDTIATSVRSCLSYYQVRGESTYFFTPEIIEIAVLRLVAGLRRSPINGLHLAVELETAQVSYTRCERTGMGGSKPARPIKLNPLGSGPPSTTILPPVSVTDEHLLSFKRLQIPKMSAPSKSSTLSPRSPSSCSSVDPVIDRELVDAYPVTVPPRPRSRSTEVPLAMKTSVSLTKLKEAEKRWDMLAAELESLKVSLATERAARVELEGLAAQNGAMIVGSDQSIWPTAGVDESDMREQTKELQSLIVQQVSALSKQRQQLAEVQEVVALRRQELGQIERRIEVARLKEKENSL